MTAADAAAANADAAADERLWRPRPPVPLERLTIWLAPGGEPAVLRDSALGPGSHVIASTTGSMDAADAPDGSRPAAPKDAEAVLALIPARHGLVVDKASADPIVIPAARLDQLRPRPIPYGTEADAAFHLPPPHVVGYLAGIRRAAQSAGAGRITATWALFAGSPGNPATAPALLLIVKPARTADRSAALDAVYRAVRDLAPPETVRVVDAATLSRGQMFRTLSGQRLVESPAPDPAEDADPYAIWSRIGPGVDPSLSRPVDPVTGKRPITGRTPFNVALAMFGSVVGASAIGLPHWFSMPAAAAVPVVAIGVLIVVVFLGLALWDFFRR
ncbi:MAG: hypothetical protein AUG49_03435 [Catenulispora sp. 13_1_20CM_3_70_7]|nr:hypothetical protein [Catenulisporales bacterium]OLE28086.1 MAG: hypothetical protein AUG49_03435 [Catenulispora sp. 13_1_20CM_3_70_7]